VGSLTNTDKIMNDSFFIGVYPGLTPAMLDYMEQVFADFFHMVSTRRSRSGLWPNNSAGDRRAG
jgi:hypothetical protein